MLESPRPDSPSAIPSPSVWVWPRHRYVFKALQVIQLCRRPARRAVPYTELSLRAGDTHTSKSTVVPSLERKERESLEPGRMRGLSFVRLLAQEGHGHSAEERTGFSLLLRALGKLGPCLRGCGSAGQRLPGRIASLVRLPPAPRFRLSQREAPGGAAQSHGK